MFKVDGSERYLEMAEGEPRHPVARKYGPHNLLASLTEKGGVYYLRARVREFVDDKVFDSEDRRHWFGGEHRGGTDDEARAVFGKWLERIGALYEIHRVSMDTADPHGIMYHLALLPGIQMKTLTPEEYKEKYGHDPEQT